MRRQRWILLAGLIAAVTLCLALVLTGTSYSTTAGLTQARRAPGLTQGNSLNWSGYAVGTTSSTYGLVTDVKGSWTVPTVQTTSTAAYSSVWVGIDGYSDSTVEQIGTEQDWTGSSGSYYAWYEMYPSAMHSIGRVYAGDTITAEVSYQGSNRFLLTITDTSKVGPGFTFTTAQTSKAAQRQSAEWICEAPSSRSGVLPLADFGSVSMSAASATINSVRGSITTWANDPITMVSSSGTPEATPSGLTDGTSFSVAWDSSGVVAPVAGGHGGGHGGR